MNNSLDFSEFLRNLNGNYPLPYIIMFSQYKWLVVEILMLEQILRSKQNIRCLA